MSAPIYHLIPNAPKPVVPYSHVVEADGWLFVTGQLATDPDDGSLPLPEGIEAQTRKVMDNLKRALAGAGAGFEDVVCVRIFDPVANACPSSARCHLPARHDHGGSMPLSTRSERPADLWTKRSGVSQSKFR